jgi:hypothetical protein
MIPQDTARRRGFFKAPLQLACGLCLLSLFLAGATAGKEVRASTVFERAEEFYRDGIDKLARNKTAEAAVDFENAVNLDADYFFLISGNRIFEKLLAEQAGSEAAQEVVKICRHASGKPDYSGDPLVLYYWGWAKWKLGDAKGARKLLKRARSLMRKRGLPYGMVERLLEKVNGKTGVREGKGSSMESDSPSEPVPRG